MDLEYQKLIGMKIKQYELFMRARGSPRFWYIFRNVNLCQDSYDLTEL